MDEFLKLPWNNPQTKDENLSFIDDVNLKKYSSTYKILHGNLQQVFSDNSSSDADDVGTQRKAKKEGGDNSQEHFKVTNSVQRCKKPSSLGGLGGVQYVPCYSDEKKIKYPKKSSLNAEQQAMYLQLLVKFAKKHSPFPTPLEQKELQQYEAFHDKVVAERFEFIHFVKQRCALTQDRYLVINPDVKKYIEEMWQHRLSRASKYPADYEPLRLLPLVYSDKKKPVVMKLEENLLEVGSIPFIFLPKFKNPIHIPTDYSRMRARFPPESDGTRNTFKIPVSEDKNAEKFAVAGGVHVVISSSALKRITDNHPPNFEKAWDLPVIVKEYKQCDNKVVKVVYVNKALPPKCLTTVEKNTWFHKFGVKSLICNTWQQKCFQLENRGTADMCAALQGNKDDFNVEGTGHTESKHNSDFNTIETSDSDDELRFSKTETKESTDGHVNSLKRKHSESCNDSDCESDMSTDTENRLVIDCSDSERNSKTPVGKNKCAQNNNVEDDSRVTRSKARLIEKMSYVNQSLGHKPVQFVTNKEYEIDNKNLREDTCKTFDGNDLEKSLKNVRLSGCFDCKDYTLDSEVANKMSHDTVRPEEEHVESWSINKSTRMEQEFPANEPGSAQKLIDVDAEAQDAMKVAGLNVSTPGFNVSYRLWKLSKDEGHPDDRKEGFLKGNCASHEIKVLVRCKVDGYKINYNKLQRFCVVPKMEYLTEYGAQCFTQSELTQQWISLHVRPGTDLYRVRVNACTSEVIMIERRSLQDVAQETVQQTGRPNSIILGTLYNVLLGLVDLDPGSYILSHTPKLGAFVNLWQSASNGRFKLHDMYKIDPKTTSVSESSLWIPIDHSVVTPFHRACNRVPGTFPPTLFFRGKPVLKKKNKKKKKKQKQKKE